MKGRFFCSLILCTCVLWVLACWSREDAAASEDPKNSQDGPGIAGDLSASPAPGQGKEDSMVVATVNGKQISRPEVDQALGNLLTQHREQIPPDQVSQAKPALWKQALEHLINQHLLVQEADRQEIKPDEKTVEDRFAEVAGRFPNPKEFNEVLDSMGMTEQEFRQEIRQNLKIEDLLDKKLSRSKEVTDEEVNAFYRDHPESFRTSEQVRASHILIGVKPEDPQQERDRKRLEASRLRGEIERGAAFEQLAQQHSDCPSKAQGGDLGFFERGRMVKPFEEAAFKLKKGEVSQVVETEFGYHLIKVTDRQESGVMALDQVRDKVASFLDRQQKEQQIGDFLANLRKTATIEYGKELRP